MWFNLAASRASDDGGAELRDAAIKARDKVSLTWPCSASAVEIARRLILPPLGFLRASAFTSLTTSGRASAWLLRSSHFALPLSPTAYPP